MRDVSHPVVRLRRHIEAAMAAKDSAGVSRFAKLFHPLGRSVAKGEGPEEVKRSGG